MKLSPPGWVLTIITTVTIATRIVNIIDPSNTTKEFNINSPEAVRLISYLLILINLYEFIAAFQDNWVACKFGIVSRLAAVGIFWGFGGEWTKVVFVELGTLVLLAELWGLLEEDIAS